MNEEVSLKTRAAIAMAAAMFVLVALIPSVASAARPKCFGKPATIVSSSSTINGTKKDDVIFSKASGDFNRINGKGGDDLICGSKAFDFIRGNAGNDKIRGRGNMDFLLGDGGNDHLYGDKNDGGNTDNVWYQFSKNPVVVNFTTGRATGEGRDTLHNIDGVFGSDFADTITGDSGTNFIWGNDGDDTIDGGGGLDLITPGGGNDVVDGGTEPPGGVDLDIYYVNDATGPTEVDLQAGTASGEGIGDDTFTGFENVVGSNFDDVINGDGQSNLLFGGSGNDAMNGAGGFDYAAYWFAAGAVNANLQTNSSTGTVVPDESGADIGEGNDTFQQIEGLLGSMDFDDTLTGDNSANYLDGDGGNDTVAAGGGNDWIVGGIGADIVDGGPGTNDFWDYYGADALHVDLVAGTITSPSLGTIQITGVESVAGADQDDTFVGDALSNTFYGWGGDDTFTGGAGDDRFDGGAGQDIVEPGDGSNTCYAVEVLGGCTESPDPIPQHDLQVEASAVQTLRRNF